MSKTSTSIGWVLVDEHDITGEPLDHDAFDITDSSSAAPAATARRIREIATASGHSVDSIHVTTSGNMSSLREALTESGFGDVVPVSLAAATQAWAMSAARANGHRHVAVCLLGRDSASLSLIDTAGTAGHSTTTISRDSTCLVDWLTAAFEKAAVRPEVLCLIGSRGKLDAFAGRLGQALSIPVLATHDAQLALARGAAFSSASSVDDQPAARRFRLAAHAKAIAVLSAVAAAALFTFSSADIPDPLASNVSPQPAPPSPIRPRDTPASQAPVAPMALPPPPAESFVPPTQEPVAAPDLWAASAATDATASPSIPTAVPNGADVAPPVQHLPDAQPAAALGPAPAPTVENSPSVPPPPPDPLADALSPLFGGLP